MVHNLVTGPAAPVSTDTVNVTVTFSSTVSGLDAGGLVVTNGAATALPGTAPGTVYTAIITPTADGVVTITVPENVSTTPTNAGNHASAPFAVRVDRVAPVVAQIESEPAGRVRAMFTLTITFSEDVSGLALTEIATTNGTASGVHGTRSAAVYTVDIQPTGDGNVTVDLAADIVADAAGNGNGAGQRTVVADVTGPTATVASVATAPVAADFTVAMTFLEPVTGFALADVALRNGVASDWMQNGSDAYEFTVRPVADGDGHVHLPAGTFTDAVGNPNAASNRSRIRPMWPIGPGAPTALWAVDGGPVAVHGGKCKRVTGGPGLGALFGGCGFGAAGGLVRRFHRMGDEAGRNDVQPRLGLLIEVVADLDAVVGESGALRQRLDRLREFGVGVEEVSCGGGGVLRFVRSGYGVMS